LLSWVDVEERPLLSWVDVEERPLNKFVVSIVVVVGNT